jgi:hypothetical protein
VKLVRLRIDPIPAFFLPAEPVEIPWATYDEESFGGWCAARAGVAPALKNLTAGEEPHFASGA